MRRYFVKFYNEIKQRPVKIPEELRKNLRNSASVQQRLRQTMKEFRSEMPLLSLVDIAKASRAHIKAYYDIPNLLSPIDESIEPALRKSFYKTVFDPLTQDASLYYVDRLFEFDNSLEARRNYLLIEENKVAEKAIRAHNEKKRIENLKALNKKKFIEDDTQIEFVLDGEVNTQLVKYDTHTVLSPKGVVELSRKPGKRARFEDLTYQEIANYICYNLLETEQALQMYTNSVNNSAFDANNRARLIQKICLLKPENPKDYRLIKLVESIDVMELNKKNVSNLIWALGKLYRTIPKSINGTYEKILTSFEHLIPKSNSMNLMYACDGLLYLKNFSEPFPEKISQRFLQLLESVPLPAKPLSPEVSHINTPLKGHSMYFGSINLTIPTTKTPSASLFKILKYLSQSTKVEHLGYLFKKSAQIINSLQLFELNKNLLIEGILLFGHLTEQQLSDEDIRDCVLNMGQLVLKYYDQLSLKEVSKIAAALMNAKGFRLATWFKLLELRAFERVDIDDDHESVAEISEKFVRYYIATHFGRDIFIEPMLHINERFNLREPLFDKIFELTKTKDLNEIVRNRIGKSLGLIGYAINTTKGLNVKSILAASVLRYEHRAFEKLDLNELTALVRSSWDFNEVCELAAVLRKHNSQIDWGYFTEFYINNKHLILSQGHRIGLFWSLQQDLPVEYDVNLLTVTESRMITENKAILGK